MNTELTVITVTGSPRERGRQIGAAAVAEVRSTISGYQAVFEAYADLSWEEATGIAERFVPSIAGVDEKYVEEMRGIALGAGVAFSDVLTINCRTEIMFSGLARKVLAGDTVTPPPAECTAFALTAERTEDGSVILAQNWDWLEFSTETLVCIHARQSDAPDYMTIVEAGLLAKAGMNEAGLGLVTTALVSSEDSGSTGLPYHVALRAILDSRTAAEAKAVVEGNRRASSANYLIASRDGSVENLECEPGDAAALWAETPTAGWISHANHFVRSDRHSRDIVARRSTDTFVRQHAVDRALNRSVRVSEGEVVQALQLHENYPLSVCMHLPEDNRRPLEDSMTVFSVMMNLTQGRAWVAVGTPCTSPFRELSFFAVQQTQSEN